MAFAIKPDYVNPLSMLGQKKNALTPKHPLTQPESKADRVQNLQLQRQSLQNQVLLLKSTSDAGSLSLESQQALEAQIEDVSAELQVAKAEEHTDTGSETGKLLSEKARFDSYEPNDTITQSPGLYQKKRDEEDGYHVQFFPFSE